MPFTAPTAALNRVQRGLLSLAQRDGAGRVMLLNGVRVQVKALLVNEFASATSPSGSTWQKTARGKQALLSRKLPNAFVGRIDQGVVGFVARTPRNWLPAHQLGHSFAARHAAAGGGSRSEVVKRRDGSTSTKTVRPGAMYFNAKGKLVKASKFAKLKRGRVVFAKAHTVGKRVLTARPMIPSSGALPPLWGAAVSAGVTIGMQQWASGMQK